MAAVPAFDERSFESPAGSVLYLQKPAGVTGRIVIPGFVVSALEGSRAIVVSCVESDAQSAEQALDDAVVGAQVALDLWAIKGSLVGQLSAPEREHISWWTEHGAGMEARIWHESEFGLKISISGHVTDKDGKPVQRPAPPEPQWHPSFRYFRLGQASTDLVDAFRNYYLALESVLSSVVPVRLRANGRPAEREGEWLKRALTETGKIIDLGLYVDEQGVASFVEQIIQDLYSEARTATFHAKDGASVLLPHDPETRQKLRGHVKRLRNMYLGIVKEYLGTSFGGRGGVTPYLLEKMADAMTFQSVYLSSDPFDAAAVGDGPIPVNSVVIDAPDSGPHKVRDYLVIYSASFVPANVGISTMRQFGWSTDGSSIGMFDDVEGLLDLSGLSRVHLVNGISMPNPASLGTRYLS